MGVCKKIKRKDDQERNVWENISEKKERPGLGTDPAEYEKKNK